MPELAEINLVLVPPRLALYQRRSAHPMDQKRCSSPPSHAHSQLSDVPEDIFRQIFEHLLEDCPDSRGTYRSASTQPFLLAAVSRSWRVIARTTPRIWDTVSLNFADVSEYPLRWRAYLDTILCLSKAVPLHVYLLGYLPKHDPGRGNNQASHWTRAYNWTACETALRLILNHSDRWSTFVMTAHLRSHDARTVLLRRFEPLPSSILREFTLEMEMPAERSALSNKATLLTRAPRLRKLKLDGAFLPYVTWQAHQQLVSLAFVGCAVIPSADLLTIFQVCPVLSHVRLYTTPGWWFGTSGTSHPQPPGPAVAHTVCLPCLTELELLGEGITGFIPLTHALSLPALEYMCLHNFSGSFYHLELLASTCKSLRRLSITLTRVGLDPGPVTLLRIVELLPNIEELSLSGSPVMSADFEGLTFLPGRTCGMRLVKLVLSDCWFVGGTRGPDGVVDALLRFVDSRSVNSMTETSILHCLEVDGNETIPPWLSLEISRRLLSTGL